MLGLAPELVHLGPRVLTFEYSCSAAVVSFFATASWSATSDCSEMRRSPFTWVSFSFTQLSFTTSLVALASSRRPSTSVSTERMRLTESLERVSFSASGMSAARSRVVAAGLAGAGAWAARPSPAPRRSRAAKPWRMDVRIRRERKDRSVGVSNSDVRTLDQIL